MRLFSDVLTNHRRQTISYLRAMVLVSLKREVCVYRYIEKRDVLMPLIWMPHSYWSRKFNSHDGVCDVLPWLTLCLRAMKCSGQPKKLTFGIFRTRNDFQLNWCTLILLGEITEEKQRRTWWCYLVVFIGDYRWNNVICHIFKVV